MREWILDKNIATSSELEQIEQKCKAEAKVAKAEAWKAYQSPIKEKQSELLASFQTC